MVAMALHTDQQRLTQTFLMQMELELSMQNNSLDASHSSPFREDSDPTDCDVSPDSDLIPAHPSPIAAFPTTNQIVLDTTMKEITHGNYNRSL